MQHLKNQGLPQRTLTNKKPSEKPSKVQNVSKSLHPRFAKTVKEHQTNVEQKGPKTDLKQAAQSSCQSGDCQPIAIPVWKI